MKKVTQISKNKIYIIPIIIILLIEFLSLYYAQFHYDGFHIGLILNVAADLEEGKLIYKDFFYEYGLLNGYLNLFILKIFNYNVFFLFLIYTQFFILAIVLQYLLTKKKFGSDYALLFIILIFIIHPYLIKPWHNYLLFLFISSYLYLKSFHNLKYDLASSLILGSAFLFSESFFVTSFIIFTIDLLYSYRVFGKKIILKKIFIFFFPLLLFFIYLFYNNLIDDWSLYNETYPVLLKYFYKTDIINFIIDHLKVFLNSYKNIFNDTVIFFYSIVFLSNFYFILINLKAFFEKKLSKNYLFFLFVASLNLVMISQVLSNIATFKLATLSSFGILIIIFFIKEIEEPFFKKLSILLIILLSLNSFFDPKKEWISNKYHFSESNINSEKFDFLKSQNYPLTMWNHLEEFDKISSNIKNKCKIKFFANFTDDAYYYYLTRDKYEFSQFLYWYRNQERYYQNNYYKYLTFLFDKDFSSRIINNMNNNNIFFVTDIINKDEIYLLDTKISFKENFNKIYLPYSSAHSKKVILLPKNCKLDN